MADKQDFDWVVLGAGVYGLYAAKNLADRGGRVAVVECQAEPFARASYINQARLHLGYHYPRSVYTARKSAGYFARFVKDFPFAINASFRKIYAISASQSMTNAQQFINFCKYMGIRCIEVDPRLYFQPGAVEAAFETEEYSFDAAKIRDWLLSRLGQVRLLYGTRIVDVRNDGDRFHLRTDGDSRIQIAARGVLNTTYASVNQVLAQFGFSPFRIKYEICEVILVRTEGSLESVGITVMDGPFFSLMPFGLNGKHSLTAVTFTPHRVCHAPLPAFPCQGRNPRCTPAFLDNCNDCSARPVTAWKYMRQLALKFLRSDLRFAYDHSLFAIKPILQAAELDDGRPTVVRQLSEKPLFVSVLSGKINTVYDLEETLP